MVGCSVGQLVVAEGGGGELWWWWTDAVVVGSGGSLHSIEMDRTDPPKRHRSIFAGQLHFKLQI